MPSKPFDYTVSSPKPFDEAVASVESKTAEKGFRVLHTHNIAATLSEKGFPREPLKLIEICNARYASEVLKRDVKISLMLPCPISVYTQAGQTFISALLPGSIAEFYPEAGIDEVALEVERAVRAIVDEAR
jgi:uncharacterized protein (DUF302 family)